MIVFWSRRKQNTGGAHCKACFDNHRTIKHYNGDS